MVCEGSDWFVGVQIGLSGLVAGFAPEPLETNPFHAANAQNLQALHFFASANKSTPRLGARWLETSLARRIKAPHLRTAEALQTHMHPRRDSKHKKTAR